MLLAYWPQSHSTERHIWHLSCALVVAFYWSLTLWMFASQESQKWKPPTPTISTTEYPSRGNELYITLSFHLRRKSMRRPLRFEPSPNGLRYIRSKHIVLKLHRFMSLELPDLSLNKLLHRWSAFANNFNLLKLNKSSLNTSWGIYWWTRIFLAMLKLYNYLNLHRFNKKSNLYEIIYKIFKW